MLLNGLCTKKEVTTTCNLQPLSIMSHAWKDRISNSYEKALQTFPHTATKRKADPRLAHPGPGVAPPRVTRPHYMHNWSAGECAPVIESVKFVRWEIKQYPRAMHIWAIPGEHRPATPEVLVDGCCPPACGPVTMTRMAIACFSYMYPRLVKREPIDVLFFIRNSRTR